MKKHVPNFLTLLNLTSGSLGIILVLEGKLTYAALCVWIGGVFDFLDGWSARLLRAYSPLGQQLDALADLLTFGMLPSCIIYRLVDQYTSSSYLPLVALCLPVFSALRLARFNTDTAQRHVFRGLPTPASGLFVSTLPWMIATNRYPWLTAVLTLPEVLAGIAVVVAYLMVAPIRCMAFKAQPNRWQSAFLLVCLLLVLSWQVEGMALALVLYVLMSNFAQSSN